MTGKTAQVTRDPARLFAPPTVAFERRAGGAALLRSPQPLLPYARCVGEYLLRWAGQAPDRPFLLERGDGGNWQGVTYGEALDRVQDIAAWLLTANVSADRPITLLSENSV